MAAIMGLDDEKVEEICKKVKSGFVSPANYNSKGQVVVSGEESAVTEAAEIAKEFGARKVMILNTQGPFHTEKLIDSSIALRKELDNVHFKDFNSKVIKNLDGTEYLRNDDIKDILSRHIVSPVRLKNGLERILKAGYDTFIEVGPRQNFIRFCKKN